MTKKDSEMQNSSNEIVCDIAEFGEQSYLNYSMYVIMDRALPFVGDGLKPVQRRLMFAMSELGLNSSSKHKKSARTVGDTLGKYHPHGDSACYEAMVAMAQSFLTRYPLIDGQGNWGSIDDPKAFAAMRYTEAKMTNYADIMLQELKHGTVDWKENFDSTLKEPEFLPSQVPNLLLNGVTGIAVGMATDIPPHNIGEVVEACISIWKDPNVTDDQLLDMVQLPDFPCGGVVVSPMSTIREAYRTGRGTIVVRGDVVVKGRHIEILTIPHRLSMSNRENKGVLHDVFDTVRNEKLPVAKITDMSDREFPIKLVLEANHERDVPMILARLYAQTPLQSTIKVNMNAISVSGAPKTFSLPEMLREWCDFRQMVFVRKNQHRLDIVLNRIHILEGLFVAFNNIERILSIIQHSDSPKEELMAEFNLSETQVKAILELRLRQLAKLELNDLKKEHDELSKERERLMELLASPARQRKQLIKDIQVVAKQFNSERKTRYEEVDESQAAAAAGRTAAAPEPLTVIMSKSGWLRSLKGHGNELDRLQYKAGDCYETHCETQSNLPILLMGDKGRFFAIPSGDLPNGKSMGEPFTSKITLQDGERISCMLPMLPGESLLLSSVKGNGFVVPADSLDTRAKKGKQVQTIPKGDQALPPTYLRKDDVELAILTKQGRLVVIPIHEINVLPKGQGVRLVSIKAEDFISGADGVASIVPLRENDKLEVFVGNRKYVLASGDRQDYRAARARRGLFFPHGRKNLSIFRQKND